MSVLTGILYLSIVLFFFSLITFKAPKGEAAMKGIAEAAIATFLVEAILKYVMGDIFGIAALGHIGSMVGSLSGLAAAILVSLFLGTDLICSVAIGLGAIEFSILPGFVSAYLLHFVIDYLKKKFKSSAFAMFFVIFSVIASYGLCLLINPAVSFIIKEIGTTVLAATNESPVVMGFILGGFINVISTSPLSSMALTAMLDLRGIPMGIANVACFAGSFANGVLFKKLKLGKLENVIGVMIEPLTQADIISKNPLSIYPIGFISGGLAGIIAVLFGITSNAPGTAAAIPGMIVPFAFNQPIKVIPALVLSALANAILGWVGAKLWLRVPKKVRSDSSFWSFFQTSKENQ